MTFQVAGFDADGWPAEAAPVLQSGPARLSTISAAVPLSRVSSGRSSFKIRPAVAWAQVRRFQMSRIVLGLTCGGGRGGGGQR